MYSMRLNFSCPKGFPKAKSLKCWEWVTWLFITNLVPWAKHISRSTLKVRSIKSPHLNDGKVELAGYLLSQGIRVQWKKLRGSIHRIDPTGTAERSVAVSRRVYHVDAVNDVWHIDGNHKLIRWRMVVHGGIEGYSCLITFLQCHTDSRSDRVLTAFMIGVHRYGLPKNVCTDQGGENIEVWRMMMNKHSTHTCVTTGSSTHNERIERLWRDVHHSVIITFLDAFW